MDVTRSAQRDRVNWSFVRRSIASILLPIWFGAYAILTFIHFQSHGLLGVDLAIYRHAAEVLLTGGNPWIRDPAEVAAFAGPPPTLLLYLPAAMVPLPVATVGMLSVGVAGAAWAIRRLGLPLWWLLFPPLFDALIVGNPDALVLPALLLGGPYAGLAAVLKVYALIPLIYQRRWSAVALAAGISALTIPTGLMFLSTASTIQSVLAENANLSAWGTWLLPFVLVALWTLRHDGAEYVAVPAAWPNTQSHYGTMSLIVIPRYPVAAALIGLNTPLFPPLAVIVMAIENAFRRRRFPAANPEPAVEPAPARNTVQSGTGSP